VVGRVLEMGCVLVILYLKEYVLLCILGTPHFTPVNDGLRSLGVGGKDDWGFSSLNIGFVVRDWLNFCS
jgi:hypothetical protein